jgi:hypothetical protein
MNGLTRRTSRHHEEHEGQEDFGGQTLNSFVSFVSFAVTVGGFALAVALAAQSPPPLIQNGRVETRSGTAIDREIAALPRQDDAIWVGWRVPIRDGQRAGCCIYSDDSGPAAESVHGCFVETPAASDGGTPPQIGPTRSPIPLEAGSGVVLLLRIVQARVDRMRTLGDDCPLDAGGRTVYWLSGVTPAESVRFLSALGGGADGLATDQQRRVQNAAASALALHREPSAVDALIGQARSNPNLSVRKSAVAALGRTRDPRAVAYLESLLK